MTTCHPKRSRKFFCACGKENEWMPDVATQACTQCQEVHARGPEGPSKEPKSCEGVGRRIRFGEAVGRAHEEFLRMMFRCGYELNRDGRLSLSSHNTKRSRYKGFSMTLTEHFAGDGDL